MELWESRGSVMIKKRQGCGESLGTIKALENGRGFVKL